MNLDSKGVYTAVKVVVGLIVAAALVYALLKGLDFIHRIDEQN